MTGMLFASRDEGSFKDTHLYIPGKHMHSIYYLCLFTHTPIMCSFGSMADTQSLILPQFNNMLQFLSAQGLPSSCPYHVKMLTVTIHPIHPDLPLSIHHYHGIYIKWSSQQISSSFQRQNRPEPCRRCQELGVSEMRITKEKEKEKKKKKLHPYPVIKM